MKKHTDLKRKYIKMLEFLVDNIFVMSAGKVFLQITWAQTVLFCRLINVDTLLLFLTIFIRYKAEIKDNRHIVDAIYTCIFSSLFVDRIDINSMDI